MKQDGITAKAFSPENSDLADINRFTRREFPAEELYTFSVILCDNEIDRDFERFTDGALEKLAELFVGKTGIFDHVPSGKNQAARIYRTEVTTDSGRQTRTGENYRCLRAKAYMIRQGNEELIAEIDGGIKKEVSVGCSVNAARCSICGADRRDGCEHRKGTSYGGQLCHHVLDEPSDAYEWSFVAVPAQVGAGVTKGFSHENKTAPLRDWSSIWKAFNEEHQELVLTGSEIRLIRQHMLSLEADAACGAIYREDLKKEVRRLAFLAEEEIPPEIFDAVVEKMNISELAAFREAYAARVDNGETRCQLRQYTNVVPATITAARDHSASQSTTGIREKSGNSFRGRVDSSGQVDAFKLS